MRRWLLIISFAFGLMLAGPAALAADLPFVPEVPIPGVFEGEQRVDENFTGRYIRAVYIYFIWAVGILATTMVIYGGIKWVAAAGNPSRINDARDVINNAIIGVIIALVSVVLLNLISPQFTTLGLPDLTPVKKNDSGVLSYKNRDGTCKPASEIPCGLVCINNAGVKTWGNCAYCDSLKVNRADNRCGFTLQDPEVTAAQGNCQYTRCEDSNQVCNQIFTGISQVREYTCAATTNLGDLSQGGYPGGEILYTQDYDCGQIWWEPACDNPVTCFFSGGTHPERLQIGRRCLNTKSCLIEHSEGYKFTMLKSQIPDQSKKTRVGQANKSGCY